MIARLTLVSIFLVLGCSGGSQSSLRTRAAFDLSCDQNQLQIVELDDGVQGVTGCGHRATYVKSCEGQGFARSCQWILNSSEKPKGAPSSGP